MHYVLVVNSTIILNLIVVCSSYLFDAYVQIKKSGNNSAKLLPKPRLSDFSGLSSCLFLGLQPERCAYPWNNKFKGMRHSQCQDNWIPSLAPWIGWSNWWRGGGGKRGVMAATDWGIEHKNRKQRRQFSRFSRMPLLLSPLKYPYKWHEHFAENLSNIPDLRTLMLD